MTMIKSSWLSDTICHHNLVGAKPLPELVLTYCQYNCSPSRTHLSEISIKIENLAFNKMNWKILQNWKMSKKCKLFCLDFNVKFIKKFVADPELTICWIELAWSYIDVAWGYLICGHLSLLGPIFIQWLCQRQAALVHSTKRNLPQWQETKKVKNFNLIHAFSEK